MIIAFEGIDGSGKSIQTKILNEALVSAGHRVLCRDYPRYTSFIGREIGDLLTSSSTNATKIDPYSMSLWYAADRAIDFRKNIEPIANDYDVIIFNRYTLSSQIFQSARAGTRKIYDWIDQLEHEQFGLPRPDLYLIMDCSPEVSILRNQQKNNRPYIDSGADIYEQDSSLQIAAANAYLQAANERADAKLINSNRNNRALSIEEIAADIASYINERTKLKL